MRYAIFSVGLPDYTPDDAVSTLRELGYDGIEWRVTDQAPSTGTPSFWSGNRCTWPLTSFVEFDPRDVGVIHDAGNMVHEGYEQYRLGLEVLGPYLAHVHLKNASWQAAGPRGDGSTAWRATWAPITNGIVDMAALFRALRSVEYDGWVSFEDFSTEQSLRHRLRDNLAHIKQVAQQVAMEQT